MNFDFDNFEKYLYPEPTPEMTDKLNKINKIIRDIKLSDYDTRFIEDIKRRILNNRMFTARQRHYLAVLLTNISAGTYDPNKNADKK